MQSMLKNDTNNLFAIGFYLCRAMTYTGNEQYNELNLFRISYIIKYHFHAL